MAISNLIAINLLLIIFSLEVQVLNPNQSLSANGFRVTWDKNCKSVDLYSGVEQGLSIKPFLNQISYIRTIDYS